MRRHGRWVLGLFDWLRRGKRGRADADQPLGAFDRRIETLSARGAELRRAAATLLAARGELERGLESARADARAVESRLAPARSSGPEPVAAVLAADLDRLRGRERDLAAELKRIAEDAEALAGKVRETEDEAERLRRERTTAAARLNASRAVAGALQAADRFDELVELDRARDEVERAHALAALCREDLQRRRGPT